MNKPKDKDRKNKWREVKLEDALYVVILRINDSETSVYCFESEEDVKWAMKNSWFDPREATVARLIDYDYDFNLKIR